MEVRGEICGRCPTPCEHQHAAAFHAAPCSACPVNNWRQYGRCERFAPPRGLGDLVAAVATPLARALRLPCIDPATQQLRPESGCAKRKAALNRLSQ